MVRDEIDRLVREVKREAKKELRRERREERRKKREQLRAETGQRFPKLRKALGVIWKIVKFVPFRPFGGVAVSAGEIFEEFLEEKKKGEQ